MTMAGAWSPERIDVATTADAGIPVVGKANVRGYRVHDRANERIGSVDDLVVDGATGKVRVLKIGMGGLFGFGRTSRLVPVDVVDSVVDGYVFLSTTRDHVDAAPTWGDMDGKAFLSEVYEHYGCRPFWSSDYREPAWTMAD
jgi:sporulation protein YlmC with PRC-barrel domain